MRNLLETYDKWRLERQLDNPEIMRQVSENFNDSCGLLVFMASNPSKNLYPISLSRHLREDFDNLVRSEQKKELKYRVLNIRKKRDVFTCGFQLIKSSDIKENYSILSVTKHGSTGIRYIQYIPEESNSILFLNTIPKDSVVYQEMDSEEQVTEESLGREVLSYKMEGNQRVLPTLYGKVLVHLYSLPDVIRKDGKMWDVWGRFDSYFPSLVKRLGR